MSTGRPSAYPRLVGDIGGTHARFALIREPGALPADVRNLACADYPGPREAILAYLAQVGGPTPHAAAFGIANPVTGDQVKMTNHVWAFSIEGLRQALGLDRLLVINDFTALALALPRLAPGELRQVGGGTALAHKAIGLVGPGTGLGISGLVPCGEGYVPLEGEGGHVTLAACDRREAELIALIAERYGHVSAERVLSGPGLVALHDAVRRLEGAEAHTLSAQDISTRAIEKRCPYCVDAVDTFCAMLGTVAGDIALLLGARGGVYIGGGVVPKLGELFLRSRFRQRFEAKGRFAAYLGEIPTWVILAPYPALLGAAIALDERLACGWDAC